MYKPPHGNSKSSTPYKHTQPSTMERMKELSSQLGPVATIEVVDKEVGDTVDQKSCGSHLWNTQQVGRQLKMKPGGDCQLAEDMELCKTGLSGTSEDFMISVQAAPEPHVYPSYQSTIGWNGEKLYQSICICTNGSWSNVQIGEILCYPNCIPFTDAGS